MVGEHQRVAHGHISGGEAAGVAQRVRAYFEEIMKRIILFVLTNVLVVAAADYWLQDAASEFIARTIVGIWPIRRDSEQGWHDLSAAKPLLDAGVVLVIFAEGSRSVDGSLGEFQIGAAKLAAETGATLLPIAILGTRQFLPRGADRAHRSPINLRLGEPIQVAGDSRSISVANEQARAEISSELNQPLQNLPGFGWYRVEKISYSLVGLAILFFWAMGEGIFWPLIAEMPLLLLIVTVGLRWRGLLLIATSALGSAAGFTITWWLVSHGFNPPSPFTTPGMFVEAAAQLQSDPTGALWAQFWNGIPVKVYAHEAGALGLDIQQLVVALLPRITRIFVIGGGGWLLGGLLKKWLRGCLGLIQVTALSFFPLGLLLAVWFWA